MRRRPEDQAGLRRIEHRATHLTAERAGVHRAVVAHFTLHVHDHVHHALDIETVRTTGCGRLEAHLRGQRDRGFERTVIASHRQRADRNTRR